MEIFKWFRFEASHVLPNVPADHPCRRLHGHSYSFKVCVRGRPDATTGWVIDFARIKEATAPLLDELDHRHLNDVAGLENPTSERIAMFIWRRLSGRVPGLDRIELWETSTAGCVYGGEDEDQAEL
jgi:6-pyruvoyltetrahydropterin/6-carboxytetrahydropterin synthase